MQLLKEHAVLHTASIDVKIIRLGKKQMTLSVFRQLDEESILLGDGTLRGTPWGRVNYSWPGNREGIAFHVVWQDGERLKRSPIPFDSNAPSVCKTTWMLDESYVDSTYENLASWLGWFWDGDDLLENAWTTWTDWKESFPEPRELRLLAAQADSGLCDYSCQVLLDLTLERGLPVEEDSSYTKLAETLALQYEKEKLSICAFVQRFEKVLATKIVEMSYLDQLFIAV